MEAEPRLHDAEEVGPPDLIRDHPYLLVTVLMTMWLGVRIFQAARYDPTVALAIAAGTTVVDLAVGVVTSALPLVVVGLAGVMMWTSLKAGSFVPAEPFSLRFLIPLLILLALISQIASRRDILMIFIVGAIAVGVYWISERVGIPLRQRNEVVVAMLIGTFVLTFLNSDELWLPSEYIESTEESFVGYVVGEANGWTTALDDDDRSVLLIPTEMIEHRTVCRLSDSPLSGPLFGGDDPRSATPACSQFTDEPESGQPP